MAETLKDRDRATGRSSCALREVAEEAVMVAETALARWQADHRTLHPTS